MAILDQGLNTVRDLLVAELDETNAGTSSSAIVFSDTGLGGKVTAASDATPVVTTAAAQFIATGTTASTDANGNDFYEWGLSINGSQFNRALTAKVTKTSDIELVQVHQVDVSR